ncbi:MULTISPECIES: YqaJ viral recombinase family nuclease [Streptomyces]|uniref:YqaJ-like viral recombinase domain protein n=1 Tax=Streptomyces fradiae ATCC 10745 = DSM 40063 TaxID=1319510 RepID=A0A1Y2NTN9_STRFR|nr:MULTISPECIES: YqaJ viral recombinase family protein [Streptomyces]KAF0651338.1 hypothetical protein K701_04195 [Streptomyces fradiae ATCC 10745 = DSM 40063]OSY50407.1 YqaJ-like viral recombinase domain protein [Streptomyces fradiae ATCC 10745 = DSM 40063]
MNDIQTPTGVLLGTYTPGSPKWEQARGGLCITATEIAAVVGLSPWQSRFSLWHKKAGLPTPPFQPNPAMEWGNRLEDAVAQKWNDEHADTTETVDAGTWRHIDRHWQRATPDRIFTPLTGWQIAPGELPQLLEIKTSPFGEEWGPSGSDEIPLHYRCQIQWQLDTLGLKVCHVAVLIGGWDYREYVVEYDEDDATLLREAAERFLDDVRHGNRPDIDSSDATYQTIRRQPDRYDDIDVEIPGPIAARYEVTHQQYKAAEAEHLHAKALLLDALGNGRNARHLGRLIAYRTAHEDGSTRALQPAR